MSRVGVLGKQDRAGFGIDHEGLRRLGLEELCVAREPTQTSRRPRPRSPVKVDKKQNRMKISTRQPAC